MTKILPSDSPFFGSLVVNLFFIVVKLQKSSTTLEVVCLFFKKCVL